MITRHDLYGIPWIDLENPTTEEIHTIIEEFNINKLIYYNIAKFSFTTITLFSKRLNELN